MKYRTFAKTGEPISLLGFGTMRLPVIDNIFSKIDETKAISMLRSAIDRGVNYVDTAYMYHDGNSEIVVGKALKDGYREKVFIADKMPIWLAKETADAEQIFENQLERLGVDCIDMYLIHNVTVPNWKLVKKFDLLSLLEKKRKEGKLKHIGFSFHDELDFFKEVIDSYPWDFCQIQFNYMDQAFQAGKAGLKYASAKGIPVIIMEPLKGGKLVDALPKSVEDFWNSAEIQRSPAEWAFRYVADFPEVQMILSGVHTMEQLDENLRILSEAEPNTLTEKERNIIEKVSQEYNKLIPYSCTDCKYCMPCTVKINIPKNIQFYNEWHLYAGSPKTKRDFRTWISPKRLPSTCTACKACEEHCPQHLPISEIMAKTSRIFE